MTSFVVLDPGIESTNTGDLIISKHARKVINECFPDSSQVRYLPTHRVWDHAERSIARKASFFIFSGSNVLSHNFPFNFQWRLLPTDLAILRQKLVLFGVGAWNYGKFSLMSRALWKTMLMETIEHSTRDNYTARMLQSIGVGATNTGCPTLWGLPRKIQFEPQRKKCIVTVTDYRQDLTRDKDWLNFVMDAYEEVILWPQGKHDSAYLRRIDPSIAQMSATLSAFEQTLETGEYDYIGTRLHAGIHSLHFSARTSIIGIDNRAIEMARDFGLPVIRNRDYSFHCSRPEASLDLPTMAIGKFKASLQNLIS